MVQCTILVQCTTSSYTIGLPIQAISYPQQHNHTLSTRVKRSGHDQTSTMQPVAITYTANCKQVSARRTATRCDHASSICPTAKRFSTENSHTLVQRADCIRPMYVQTILRPSILQLFNLGTVWYSSAHRCNSVRYKRAPSVQTWLLKHETANEMSCHTIPTLHALLQSLCVPRASLHGC